MLRIITVRMIRSEFFRIFRTIAANSDGLRVIAVSTVTKAGLLILRVIMVVGNME